MDSVLPEIPQTQSLQNMAHNLLLYKPSSLRYHLQLWTGDLLLPCDNQQKHPVFFPSEIHKLHAAAVTFFVLVENIIIIIIRVNIKGKSILHLGLQSEQIDH